MPFIRGPVYLGLTVSGASRASCCEMSVGDQWRKANTDRNSCLASLSPRNSDMEQRDGALIKSITAIVQTWGDLTLRPLLTFPSR